MSGVPVSVAIAALVLSGCAPRAVTPTPLVLSDTFLSARAFVDANGSGSLDESDPPLEGAIFIVNLQGAEFGDQTDADGYAFVTIPGSVDYPIRVTMRPPIGSAYELVGAPDVAVGRPGDRPQFLFRSR